MRIFYIANIRVPSEKAHVYQILKTCEALARAKAEVTLVYPVRAQTPGMKKIKNFRSYYQVRKNFSLKQLPCLDLFVFFGNALMPLQGMAFFIQAFTFSLAAALWLLRSGFQKGDVIYTRDIFLMGPFLLLKKFMGTGLFLEFHTFLKKWPVGLLKKADGLIVITNELKKLYRKSGIPETRILMAHDGVDLARFSADSSRKDLRKELKLPLGRSMIGYMGRFQTLEQEKGIPELIRALALLKKDLPSVCLCCVGGPMESVPGYRALAGQEQIPGEDLLFIDKVPGALVPRYLAAFDACVMPFPWTDHYAYYMSPLKMFEYMASGRPVVATDLPSVREVLTNGRNAVLVRPGDARSLAQGLKKVITDRRFGARISREALRDVKKYDWSVRGAAIVRFLKEKSAS